VQREKENWKSKEGRKKRRTESESEQSGGGRLALAERMDNLMSRSQKFVNVALTNKKSQTKRHLPISYPPPFSQPSVYTSISFNIFHAPTTAAISHSS